MRMLGWFAVWVVPWACVSTLGAATVVFEHPAALLDAYDADESCWVGMGPSGEYPVDVVPSQWLVGPPPSELSAVTMPEDHWVDLLFSGGIVKAPGDDIEMTESGKAGEQAIIFLTDGADREYVVGMVQAENAHIQALSYISLDLPEIEVPFVPRVVRLVAVDYGGGSPGFDLGCLRARISDECGSQARYPSPVSGAVDVPADANLVWTPACGTRHQYLYLSELESLVRSGDPNVRHEVQPADANSFELPALRLGRTYYWRVDALEAEDSNEIAPGDVWSFTLMDHLLIEDFDDYSAWAGPFLYETWHIRSRGRVSVGSPYIYRSCRQAMAFSYYFDNAHYSETFRRFDPPQDWTQADIAMLQLWLYGDRNNATQGQMYVTLSDGQAEQRVRFQDDVDILTRREWYKWQLALSDFNDVNLANIESITLGFCWPSVQVGQFGEGTIYVDDIALYPPLCLDEHRPTADVTCDCAVDYADLEQMARAWLDERAPMASVRAPRAPVLWYRFDGDAGDSMAGAHGQVQGRPTYSEGVHGQAIRFLNRGDAVTVSNAPSVFGGIRDAITIAFWQNGEDSSHRNDTLCCSNFTYGVSNPSIAVHLGCWRDPGQYRWDCGSPWSFEHRLAGRHRAPSEWRGAWNHWAFTKDIGVGPD